MTTEPQAIPTPTEAQVIANLATAAAGGRSVWAGHSASKDPNAIVFVVPDGASIEIVDLEEFSLCPRRQTGIVRPATVDDFVRYVERYGDENTTVWVHPTRGRVVAIIDDHKPNGDAGFGEHRAVFDVCVAGGDHSDLEQVIVDIAARLREEFTNVYLGTPRP